MANDTQNSPEGRPSRNQLFGIDLVVDPRMPADEVAMVSHAWDPLKGRMVVLDRVTVKNLAAP